MPTPAFQEYREIAQDFRRLSNYGFPRHLYPQIAVAFQQENQWIGQPHTEYVEKINELPAQGGDGKLGVAHGA